MMDKDAATKNTKLKDSKFVQDSNNENPTNLLLSGVSPFKSRELVHVSEGFCGVLVTILDH